MTQRTSPHPWIAALQVGLDGLEKALLQGDAPAVERASQHVQAVLKKAPRTADFGVPGSRLRDDMQQAAHRFGLLRQAVLRAQAQSQRAVQSLLPQQATGTYGRLAGQNSVHRRRRPRLPVGLSADPVSCSRSPTKNRPRPVFCWASRAGRRRDRAHAFSDGACMWVPK